MIDIKYNDNNTIINYINRVMKILMYEHILAQKQFYLININEVIAHIFGTVINYGAITARFNPPILKQLMEEKSKSAKVTNRLRPLAISEVTSNMLERLLLYFIDLIKKDNKNKKTKSTLYYI